MARRKDRFAHLAATKTETAGRAVHVAPSAIEAGADARYLRQSIETLRPDDLFVFDSRPAVKLAQIAALKHKGLL